MPSIPPPQGPVATSSSPFLELADLFEQRGEPKMRDRFLILAADAAQAAGRAQEADRLLQRLLQGSPHHLLKAYRSFEEALRADVVRPYLSDLRQNYPPEIVASLLQSMRGNSSSTVRAAPLPAAVPPPSRPEPTDDQTAILYPPPAAISTSRNGNDGNDTVSLPSRSEPSSRPAARSERATPRPAVPAPAATVPVASPTPRSKPPAPPPAAPVSLASAPEKPEEQKAPDPPGSWLSALLFGVVFVLGLAAAVYALARPFLPPGWRP